MKWTIALNLIVDAIIAMVVCGPCAEWIRQNSHNGGPPEMIAIAMMALPINVTILVCVYRTEL